MLFGSNMRPSPEGATGTEVGAGDGDVAEDADNGVFPVAELSLKLKEK